MKTNQEIFDIVAVHLLTQGKKSLAGINNSSCVYRDPNGRKCAIGVLIADEHYSEELERKSVWTNEVVAALEKSGFDTEPPRLNFLDELQRIHDGYAPAEWRRMLVSLAYAHRLSTDALKPFAPAL